MKPVAGAERVRVWLADSTVRAEGGPTAPVEVWGLSLAERLCRTLRAAGVSEVQIATGTSRPPVCPDSPVLVFRTDYVFDERLIRALLEKSLASSDARSLALVDPATPATIVAVVTTGSQTEALLPCLTAPVSVGSVQREHLACRVPADLVPAYSSALRKYDPPYLLRVGASSLTQVENRMFRASYKGITDVVTKWVWPLPARAVTRLLARAHVSPNIVTGLSWILVGVATWLFVQGQFGPGLVCAWLMTFLDTVDGKLARVTCTSSRMGHVLDHGLDLVHPPFWYLAWAMGLAGSFSPALIWYDPVVVIIVGGYILGRLLEGLFLLVFHLEIHSWRPIDSFFRTITARRNPNLILLTLGILGGRPDLGFWLVAVWTVCSLGFHTLRLGQACIQRWRGRPIQTWQEAGTLA